MSPTDLGWLVGLFEGEGCIGRSNEGRPSVVISMTDEDVIRRAHAIAGVGHVKMRPTPTVGMKFMWVWLVGRCDEAAALLEVMLPLLCSRRGERARVAIAAYKNGKPPKRLRTVCPKGHPYDSNNTWISRKGSRACKACSVLNQQAYRARFPERVRESQARTRERRRLTLSGATSN